MTLWPGAGDYSGLTISHSLSQVMWLDFENFIFKKDAKIRTKKTQKCWVILCQHLCVFQDPQVHCGILMSPHIPYNPKSICHVELHSNFVIRAKKHGETSVSIFELTFMMNSMRHWNCAGHGHTFNKVEFHVSIFLSEHSLASRDVNMNLHSKKLIIFQI